MKLDKSFNFPKKLIRIGFNALKMCKELTEIIIPDTVKEIKYFAFCDCTSLKNCFK